jgi:tRNA pseudouridine32 synthase/23S rRNA pseudouridine746 synthase
VPLYKNKPPVRATAPVPPQMRELLMACGWIENEPASNPGATVSPPA